ncbi:MAG: FkbM family methyltransferase [Acidimicrobiales bacterium]
MLKLLLKQLVVDTPIATLGQRLRWIWRGPQRIRHPELWDLYLEDRRIDLALSALIGPGHNCVDVGAHIGSMLAEIRRLAPHGSHVAFEPVPYKARRLRRKFSDVAVIEAATSEEPGTALFYDDIDRPGFSGLTRPVDESKVKSYEVRLVCLDIELASYDRIDFIKIDVEGAELSTLRGADAILNRHRPAVLFECGTDVQLQRFGYKRVDLFDFFSERAYDVYSMVDFVYGRHPMSREGYEKAGTYPYGGFNYVALPVGSKVSRLL